MNAIDGDRGINNPVEYSIGENTIKEDVPFTVEKHTGIVRTTKTLDREKSPDSGAYILPIVVSTIA